MALGDLTLFEEFSDEISNIHDLDADTFSMALITSAVAPTAADATPNLSDYTECANGGAYTTGGVALTTPTFTEAAGTATFDAVDITFTQNASSPTNARWGLIVNTTNANAAVCFLDLGSDFDMTTGDLDIVFHASGIFTLA